MWALGSGSRSSLSRSASLMMPTRCPPEATTGRLLTFAVAITCSAASIDAPSCTLNAGLVMISRTSMSELLRTQCQLTQTNAMPTMASHCTVAAPHSTETGPPPSVALQRYLPHQRRPLRGSREQGQGPSVGLSTLAQVVQPALHRVGRH